MIANLKRMNRIVDGIRVALGDSLAMCFRDIRPELGRKRASNRENCSISEYLAKKVLPEGFCKLKTLGAMCYTRLYL